MDEERVIRPKGHEVGMSIEAMSVEELADRITLLEAEILRLQNAIAARNQTRQAADSLFKL